MSVVVQGLRDLAPLFEPIDAQAPAGLFDMEDETYQAIDQELVKLGGLHETSIDWPYVEEAAWQYLEQRCKHLRVVAHLGAAWLRKRCWSGWTATLQLLVGIAERYWETAHPKPGPTGLIAKRKLAGLILGRLIDALPRLDGSSYSVAQGDAARAALEGLQRLQAVAQLDAHALAQLQQLLLKHLPARCDDAPSVAQAPAPLVETLGAPKPGLPAGSDREARRAVLQMAERINRIDPYDPVGYQLRRFGTWAHIQHAPMSGPDNRTELMAVPIEVVRGFEQSMNATAVDPLVLARIETTLNATPYWFRGHFIAAALARRMAMGEVAEAIRSATARFLQRLPALQPLCFSDGSSFMDQQCLAWLKSAQGSGQGVSGAQAFEQLREALDDRLERGGVEPVLQHLQALQPALQSPRERCHITLIAADLLAARGVRWLADELCASAARSMRQTPAHTWEPELFQRLEQYALNSALADRSKEPMPS